MGVDLYLVPKTLAKNDPATVRDWVDREDRRFEEIPNALDPAIETRKRKLADLLLKMLPRFSEFEIRYEEIAQFERIPVEDARRKYRYIEINGPGTQFTVFDQYIAIGIYSELDTSEFDAVLAALSAEGGLLLFDPQSDEFIDLGEEFFV